MTLMPSYKNYADFYRRSGYSKFPQEHRVSTARLPFSMFSVEQGPHNFTDPGFDEVVLVLLRSVEPGCRWRRMTETCSDDLEALTGAAIMQPPGIDSHWEVDASRSLLILSVSTATLRKTLKLLHPTDPRQAFEALWLKAWIDPVVGRLMESLWETMHGDSPATILTSESLLTAILARLVTISSVEQDSHPAIALPRWRFLRVQSFVDEHLSQRITLEDMAAAAGLSRRHFTRSFLLEMGETPHKWLMGRRLAKAIDLIERDDAPLCEVAATMGFANQSHMTTLLKKSIGATPGRLRDARKS